MHHFFHLIYNKDQDIVENEGYGVNEVKGLMTVAEKGGQLNSPLYFVEKGG